MNDASEKKHKKPRYFERPDEGEVPHTFWEVLAIILSTHLGVRTSRQREEDFRRANGVQLFVAGVLYFILIIIGLVLLVRHVVK